MRHVDTSNVSSNDADLAVTSNAPLSCAEDANNLRGEVFFFLNGVSTLQLEMSEFCVPQMTPENKNAFRNILSRFRSQMQVLRMECRVLVQERPLPVSADDSLLPDDVALVAAPSFGGAAAPSFGKTLLWTAIEQRSMAEHLSSQFGCHFEEKAHVNGVLSDIQGGESEA